MARLIQKFGGSSVASLDRIEAVAERILAARRAGDEVVVVVSAMAGETDRLLGLAQALCDRHRPNPRELDVLLSTGEQVTIALLSMALEKRQCSARSFTGGQVKVLTDAAHTKARIREIDKTRLEAELAAGRVPVVAGFQGVTDDGLTTTLGRGGSDTTAVALAAALGADECQIFTDVDGVYTTDPRVVPEARRLDVIGVEEMLEMASLGAKVLQIRAVEFAGKYKVPLRVLSTFERGAGTLISYGDALVERPEIAGIAFSRREAEVLVSGLPAGPDMPARILSPLARANLDIDMLIQRQRADGQVDLAFSMPADEAGQAVELLQALAAPGTVELRDNVAKLSLVGVGIRSHAQVAAKMFETLAEQGISVRLVSTSEVKISVLVDAHQLDSGVRALHRAFELDQPQSGSVADRDNGAENAASG